jgi:glycosyltransferase involved in cell wall biosynthesis
MNILHVIRGLTNSSGTTHIVGPLAEAQARLGHKVSVYFVEKPPFEAVMPSPDLVCSRVFPVTILRKNPGVSIPLARSIERDVRQFDVVHVHAIWNFPSFYAMRTAMRAGVPYMVAPQGSLEPWALNAGSPIRSAYVAHVEGPLIRRANRMQALSQNEQQQFRDFGYSGPVSIIPNGVAAQWLTVERGSLARLLDLPDGERTLLFLSRVHPKKGLDILVKAFAKFSMLETKVTLVIAGHDAGSGYLETLKRLVGELGLTARCRFLGEVSGAYKQQVIAGADAFALISHSEGLPVAVLEALASGLPVLITPGCNLPEIIDADAGLVVEPDPDAVAAGIRALFSAPDRMRQHGANGRHLVAQRFTWPKIALQTIDAYASMSADMTKLGASA